MFQSILFGVLMFLNIVFAVFSAFATIGIIIAVIYQISTIFTKEESIFTKEDFLVFFVIIVIIVGYASCFKYVKSESNWKNYEVTKNISSYELLKVEEKENVLINIETENQSILKVVGKEKDNLVLHLENGQTFSFNTKEVELVKNAKEQKLVINRKGINLFVDEIFANDKRTYTIYLK